MKLGKLLEGIDCVEQGASQALDISSLAYDSRRVEPGTLFFAISGNKSDGHEYVPVALEKGAVAVVSERPAPQDLSVSWVQVPKIRRALSLAGRNFYNRPDRRLELVGITGTNGKTTTAYLIESIFSAAGMATGVFGTIEHRLPGRVIPALNTTPESLDLWMYLADLLDRNGKAAVMEVSSHALAQERVWGFHFDAAVFTNLTRDHLDYHKDLESYFAAKSRLFEGLGAAAPDLAVINQDDPWGARLLGLPFERRFTYGLGVDADLRARQFSQAINGLDATITTPEGKLEIHSSLLGRANLYNILAASATAVGLGISREKIQEGIAGLKNVSGRFERVDEGQPFLVAVDYAHTDDALRNILTTARELTRGRLIVVFGCGGDRDREKRPLMGEAAGSLSDVAILTSDNPRGEDPLLIMNDVRVGLQRTGSPHLAEVDRETAISKALGMAREGDVVVIAGKGHETCQIFKDRMLPFDDRAVARKILREMGFEKSGQPSVNASR